jgi:hypothetical protein
MTSNFKFKQPEMKKIANKAVDTSGASVNKENVHPLQAHY